MSSEVARELLSSFGGLARFQQRKSKVDVDGFERGLEAQGTRVLRYSGRVPALSGEYYAQICTCFGREWICLEQSAVHALGTGKITILLSFLRLLKQLGRTLSEYRCTRQNDMKSSRIQASHRTA